MLVAYRTVKLVQSSLESYKEIGPVKFVSPVNPFVRLDSASEPPVKDCNWAMLTFALPLTDKSTWSKAVTFGINTVPPSLADNLLL